MKKNQVIILFIIPAIFAFAAVLLHDAHGPYWIGYNSDPDYLYLINSLALAEFKKTITTGNPGTTLQMLGALTMHIVHFLDYSSSESLETSVLRNPEYYLTIINIVLIMLNAIMFFIIGYETFSLMKNMWLSLMLQSSPFLANGMLTHGLLHVSPEPLLMFSCSLFVIVLLKIIRLGNISRMPDVYYFIVASALICGFGMATKITFFPVMIIPFFILPRLRNKILFLIITLLSFILWTWPIVFQYKNLLHWYCKILTHTGYYGLGAPGMVDGNVYFRGLLYLLSGYPLCFLILFFAAFFMIINWRLLGKKEAGMDVSARILIALIVAQLCAVVISAKHPADRYLIPVFSLSGFMLFLMFHQKKSDYSRLFGSIKRVSVFAVVIVLVMGLRIYDVKNIYVQKKQIKQEALFIHDKLEKEFKDSLKIAYCIPSLGCSPHPASALSFANFFIADGLYSAQLQKIYGDFWLYNILNGKFYTWTTELSGDDVIELGSVRGIIFYGSPLYLYGDKIVSFAVAHSNQGIKALSIENIIFEPSDDPMSFKCSPLNTSIDKTDCGPYKVIYLKDILGGEYETIYTVSNIKAVY